MGRNFVFLFLAAVCLWAQDGSVVVRVTDLSGLPVNAQGELQRVDNSLRIPFHSGAKGIATVANLAAGDYRLLVSGTGFAPATLEVSIRSNETKEVDVVLRLAAVGTSLVVSVIPGNLDTVPGSTAEVTREQLDLLRPFSVKEALRRMAGVHVVDEDSFGLNLNVGLRGLDPRRTQRTLILEDGAPIHLAPYADPSAHYHTPPEIVESIELLKGSGQVLHGPQTVGGMMNFVTEAPPAKWRGSFGADLGNRNFRGAQAKLGNGGARGGVLGHLIYREGDGVREHHGHRILHSGLNGSRKLTGNQTLQLKGGYYQERSRTGEAGLDEARFARNPLGNPFLHDRFVLDRWNVQAIHGVQFNDQVRLTNNFYYQKVDRTSYRQIDDSSDEMTAVPATGCVGEARRDYENFAGICGNKMRPRNYEFFGIEPQVNFRGNWFGMRNDTTGGVRYHREDVTRRRFNGFTPTARETDANVFFRDWNTIRAHAGAAFVRSQFTAGDLILTPGVRLETIHATNRVLRRGNVERNQSLAATQTLLLPGMGVTYRAFSRANFFAGVHQGFAPPRPDDNFDPLDPNVVPVNAERSTNYEAGVRAYPFVGLQLEATVFRMDFANQIVAGETVGLPQLTWANGGKTLNAGAELSVRYDLAPLLPSAHNLFFALAYTNLFTAKFNSDLIIDGTNVRGFRSPYAPRHLFSPSMTYQHRSRFNATLSAEVISRQFGDALNTMAPGANGQEGLLPGWGTYNAAVNIPVPIPGATLFLNGTNLADRRYIVSRVDGIHPGRPRQVFGGLRWMF